MQRCDERKVLTRIGHGFAYPAALAANKRALNQVQLVHWGRIDDLPSVRQLIRH